jgi:ribose/xylose/arabinose/galactoside ABC-type transport system permease subunit
MALGLAEVITGGVDLRDIPTVMVNTIGFGNAYWQIPALAVIAAVVVVLGIVLLHRTRFGLHTYALGSNPEAGRRAGLNVNGHLIRVYALSGLLAGFAGWLNLAFFQSTTIGGQSTTNLSVIAGVVIGGTSLFGGYGSIFGSIVGLFIPATLQDGFVIIGIQPFWQQVVVGAVLIAAVIIVLGAVGLHRTRFGLHTYAIGSNPEAGRRAGVNVPRHLIMIYALSGLLAGFAGWLNLAFFQSTTIGGQTSTNLSVIAGVVIGGTSLFGGYGSILGSVIGVFIPATLQNGFVIIGIQPFWQQVVVGAVLIAAVYVDQHRRAAALRGGKPRMGLLAHLVSSRQPATARE